ncbi:hypothetical protein [Apilactobacillus micheneri]|uniref:hypothetical protein n=1 Tax=Apilactobacillus micheneri TaxID=1899430 RepID=UPI000D524A86|nr:hypothetical protein [Apilactobacillus micheneri]GAY79292.1 hypothetical protein NBRC113063_00126 [Apilactobacillus micheneri]
MSYDDCSSYEDTYSKMKHGFNRKPTDYEKGMQKAIMDQNTFLYIKDRKIMSKIYTAGISNKSFLRKLFNKPHSEEYKEGYSKGLSMFDK